MKAHLSIILPVFGLAAISGILSLVFALRAASYLNKHSQGTPISFWDVRFHPLRYFKQYRELTTKENGKPGTLFPMWLVAISLFAVLMIFLIILILTTISSS